MLQIATTIIPIFLVIFIGLIARKREFITPAFIGPANRLVYVVAIPAMIFRAISRVDFHHQFNGVVLAIVLSALLSAAVLGWLSAGLMRMRRGRKGTFVQSSFHCNLGYIGLAVAYYYLGDNGLAAAGILAGFVMIAQNVMAVIVLQFTGVAVDDMPGVKQAVIFRLLGHPVILAALGGIAVSLARIGLPPVVDRTLHILSSMALPMALLLIGASLSLERLRTDMKAAAAIALIKLVAMPGIGFGLFKWLAIPGPLFLPGLILLGAPTATLAYVMAKDMGGDDDLAVAAISATTLLSAVTYAVWLHWAQ